MSTYICKKCQTSKEIDNVRTVFQNGKLVHIDLSTHEEICCEKCGSPLIFKKSEENYTSNNISKYNSMSMEDKQLDLRKRSKADSKKQKYVDQDREKTFYNA